MPAHETPSKATLRCGSVISSKEKPENPNETLSGRHTSLNRIFERSAARLSPANSGSRRPVTIQMSEEA